MTVGVLILAAGQSSRMGTNKLLRELGGKPMLAYLLETVRQAGLPALGVTGSDRLTVEQVFRSHAIPSVHHPGYAHGMASTIKAGIAAFPDHWCAAIIALGDMPFIPADVLLALAEHASPDALVAPAHQGRRGHPVLWGRGFFDELSMLKGDAGARALIDAHQDRLDLIDWPDDRIFVDADTPEAFEALVQRLG